MPNPPGLMKEKRSPRGLVPDMAHAIQDTTYNAFLAEVAPRTDPYAQYALAASTDPRFREFLRLLGEPRLRRNSLAYVAKACDISLPEWGDFWRKAQMTRALAAATNAIPALTTDMIGDAATQHVTCERCDGFGTLFADEDAAKRKKSEVRTCPNCKGLGTTRKPGDQHSRDKLLEMTGLTGKKGAAVVINQSFGGMAIESATERLSGITFDISADDPAIDPPLTSEPEG